MELKLGENVNRYWLAAAASETRRAHQHFPLLRPVVTQLYTPEKGFSFRSFVSAVHSQHLTGPKTRSLRSLFFPSIYLLFSMGHNNSSPVVSHVKRPALPDDRFLSSFSLYIFSRQLARIFFRFLPCETVRWEREEKIEKNFADSIQSVNSLCLISPSYISRWKMHVSPPYFLLLFRGGRRIHELRLGREE